MKLEQRMRAYCKAQMNSFYFLILLQLPVFFFITLVAPKPPKARAGEDVFGATNSFKWSFYNFEMCFFSTHDVYQFIKYKNPKLENNMILQKTEGGVYP